MAFKTVADLASDTAITLGGSDKKTGKPNPKTAEGYYIGFKTTTSKFGDAKLHIVQTPKGNLGIWGKTDMDNKLSGVIPGSMVRITYTGEVPSGKGNPMKKFTVEVDDDNRIEVAGTAPAEGQDLGSADDQDADLGDDTDLEDDEPMPDEVPPQRAQPAKQAAQAPSADRQKRVQELLRSKRVA